MLVFSRGLYTSRGLEAVRDTVCPVAWLTRLERVRESTVVNEVDLRAIKRAGESLCGNCRENSTKV
jgi:hypothetical protein